MKTLNPNDFGENLLVENCQQIRIEDFLRTFRTEMKRLILNIEIQAIGLNIDLATTKTCFAGVRFWFACPLCKQKIGVLYTHPITHKMGCRKCLGLEYRKRKYKGMIEGEHTLQKERPHADRVDPQGP